MEHLSKIQIIEETVAYYSENPKERRGLNENESCVYSNEEQTRFCAVGRVLINPLDLENKVQEHSNYSDGTIDTIGREYSGNIQEVFKEQYRGHEMSFWRELQILHDDFTYRYWTDDSITEEGLLYVKKLKEKYNN